MSCSRCCGHALPGQRPGCRRESTCWRRPASRPGSTGGGSPGGARQWSPDGRIAEPVKSLVVGLPLDRPFRTKGQLAIDISTDAAADGIRFDFACGDEVYGSCTQLREFFEDNDQAYVLRVPSNFTLTLAAGTKMTCAEA